MENGIRRRTMLLGLAELGALAALPSDRSQRSAREHHPYPYNPDRPLIEGRPVQILVDPRETVRSGRSFRLPAEAVPPLTPILTPRMQELGYKEYVNSKGVFYQPASDIPSEQLQPFRDVLVPLDNLRSDRSASSISIFVLDTIRQRKGIPFNGTGYTETNHLSLEFTPDLPIPEERVQMTAFHEGVHTLEGFIQFPASYDALRQSLVDDAENMVTAFRDNVEKKYPPDEASSKAYTGFGVPSDISPATKALGPLGNILAESSYLEPEWKDIGHPLTNVRELFASTITVARYFPNSLIASINALVKPEDKELMRTIVRDSIQLLRDYADSPERADAMFALQLLQFIHE